MNAREKELLARHCLLHLDEIPAIWHKKQWEKLAAVVEYAQQGIPVEMSKTDPFMYRKLCAGLCEYNIRGFNYFDLTSILHLANAAQDGTLSPASDTVDGTIGDAN